MLLQTPVLSRFSMWLCGGAEFSEGSRDSRQRDTQTDMRVLSWVAAVMALGSCIFVQREPAAVGPPPPAAAPPGYRPHGPVSCSGGQDVHLQGVYIWAPDAAVQVSGGCDVIIEN